MKLRTIDIVDVGLPGHRHLDLTTLPDGLIAIVGGNGTGKSILLEASCPGALYRRLPSRQPYALVDHARSRQGRIDVTYDDNGHTWRLLHKLDVDRRKSEAHIYRDGVPWSDGDLVSNGKLRTFDALVAAQWPTWELVAASRFWAQGGLGRFGGVDAASRREMLRELLQLHALEDVADRARGALVSFESRLAEMRAAAEPRAAEIARLGDPHGDVSAMEQQAIIQADGLAEAREHEAALERELERARAAIHASESARAWARLRQLQDRRDELNARRGPVVARRDQASELLQTTHNLLEDARVHRAKAQQAQSDRVRALTATKRASDRVASARTEAGGGPPPDVVAANVAERCARDVLITARAQSEQRTTLQEAARQARHQHMGLASRAAALDRVPCGGVGEYANCPLIADAVVGRNELPAAAAERDAAAARFEAAGQVDAGAAQTSLDRAVQSRVAAEHRCRALERLREAEADLVDAEIGVPAEVAVPDISAEESAARAADADLRVVTDELVAIDAELRVVATEIDSLPDEATLEAAAAETGDARPPSAVEPELVAAHAARRELERAVAYTDARLARRRPDIERLEALHDADATDRERITATNADRDRLARIAYGYGTRGIQAVLVEDAGPAIESVAAALLEDAYDWRRITIEIRTLAERRAGGHKDVSEVIVRDGHTGWHGPLANLSGGEGDMVAAALAMAVAAHHAEASGVRWQTAWADEAGSALTREHAEAWVRMLRRAMSTAGISQLLLVTHDEHVQRGCDAIVQVADLEVDG